MKKIIRHDIPHDTAKRVIDKAVAQYKGKFPQYKPSFEWTGDNNGTINLTAFGKTITADITLRAGEIEVNLTVPPAFKMFEGAALKAIDEEVEVWLKKAKSGKV